MEVRKTRIIRSKPVYLYILYRSKTWPKYGGNAKLCCMDTDSFLVHVKTDDIYKDIAKDVETRFDTSNFEISRSLPKGKK